MKYVYCIFFVTFCTVGVVPAQVMSLEEVKARYTLEAEKLKEQRVEKEDALRESYLTALLRMELKARTDSDLDGVLAAQREIERVEKDSEPLVAHSPPVHHEVLRMQNLIKRQVKVFQQEEARGLSSMVENLVRFADTRSRDLTRVGDIDAALAWRGWSEELAQSPEVVAATRLLRESEARQGEGEPERPAELHPALRGNPLAIIDKKTEEFEDGTRAFLLGNEPEGNEKRINESTPNAAGSGHALLQGRLRLVDEDNTLARQNNRWVRYHHRAHMYVPRVQLTPLPGRELGRTLVVFDLFKRGSGSRREVIRTDTAILPPIAERTQVVVDAGVYAYETSQHRTSWGSRGDHTTADQFYGFIVTLFDAEGNLIYQRCSDRALDSHARTEPPTPPGQ